MLSLRNLIAGAACVAAVAAVTAQPPNASIGEAVPRDVRELYEKGLQFLAQTQTENGDWRDGYAGPAVTGMTLMAFLASGEDPNYGLYSNNVRRAVRNLISGQDASTGYFSEGRNSMYDHGFAMLALAEAYGTVDDRQLWPNGKKGRTIGQALELAVRCAVTSQRKNPLGGWRYGPDATDADTSVSGAVLVGLLAARNAGIEVPDENIDRAISYYTKMTSASGQVAYSGLGFGESQALISIGCLVYSLARRKDLPQFKATLGYLKDKVDATGGYAGYLEYQRYYQAQALFQGDVEAWKKWNKLLVAQLKAAQQPDGSIPGQFGKTLGTSMSLLALALNYKFLPIYER